MKSLFNEKEVFDYDFGSTKKLKPGKAKGKFVGLELEIISKAPRELLSLEFRKAGLTKYVNLAGDSSIKRERYYPYCHEIRCLIPQMELNSVIKKVCNILEMFGSKANNSCGLHVHLDMRKRKVAECYTKLVDNLPTLKTMVAEHRVNGRVYNKMNKTNNFEYASKGKPQIMVMPESKDVTGVITPEYKYEIRANKEPRNSAINPHSYKKHKTLEVRLKEGTVDSKDITKWVNKLVKIVDNKKAS